MALVQTCEVDENEASYFSTTVDDETITKSLYNANGKCGNVGVSSTRNQVTKCDFSTKGQPVPISFSVGQAKKTVVADIDVMCFTDNRYGVVVAMNNPSSEDEEPVEEQEGDGFMTKKEKMDDSAWMYDENQDHSDLSGMLGTKGDSSSEDEDINDGRSMPRSGSTATGTSGSSAGLVDNKENRTPLVGSTPASRLPSSTQMHRKREDRTVNVSAIIDKNKELKEEVYDLKLKLSAINRELPWIMIDGTDHLAQYIQFKNDNESLRNRLKEQEGDHVQLMKQERERLQEEHIDEVSQLKMQYERVCQECDALREEVGRANPSPRDFDRSMTSDVSSVMSEKTRTYEMMVLTVEALEKDLKAAKIAGEAERRAAITAQKELEELRRTMEEKENEWRRRRESTDSNLSQTFHIGIEGGGSRRELIAKIDEQLGRIDFLEVEVKKRVDTEKKMASLVRNLMREKKEMENELKQTRDPSISTAGTGIFGQPAASTAAPSGGFSFGGTTAAAPAATTSAAPSTATAAPPTGGLFGAPATATAAAPAATGLFGAAPAATTAAPATGGLFGATTTTAAPAGGLFGAPATTAAPAGGGLFRTPTTTTAPAAGRSSSGLSAGRIFSASSSPSMIQSTPVVLPFIFDQIGDWFRGIIDRRKVISSAVSSGWAVALFFLLTALLQASPRSTFGDTVYAALCLLLSPAMYAVAIVVFLASFAALVFITLTLAKPDTTRRLCVLRKDAWAAAAILFLSQMVLMVAAHTMADASMDSARWLFSILAVAAASLHVVFRLDYRLVFGTFGTKLSLALWECASLNGIIGAAREAAPLLATRVAPVAVVVGSLYLGPYSTLLAALSPSTLLSMVLCPIAVLFLGRTHVRLTREIVMKPMHFPLPPPYAVRSPTPAQTRTMLNVLEANDATLKIFALTDLARLSRVVGGRRLEIFSLSQPGGHPRNWTAIKNACVRIIEEAREKVECATRALGGRVAVADAAAEDDAVDRQMLLMPERIRQQVYSTAVRTRHARSLRATAALQPRVPPQPTMMEKVKRFLDAPLGVVSRHDATLVQLAAESLHLLVVASFDEDRYGVVQRDLAEVLRALLRAANALREHVRMRNACATDSEEDAPLRAMEKSIATAVYQIKNQFGDCLRSLSLSKEELEAIDMMCSESAIAVRLLY